MKNIEKYDTTLKDIAGISDIAKLYRMFNEYNVETGNDADIASAKNTFGVRTEKTTSKVLWAVRRSLLIFRCNGHIQLLKEIFSDKAPTEDQNFAFFWHFSLMNKLFREISVHVFSKVYFSGRVSISHEDIIPFIKEIKDNTGNPLWSENTIYRLATKYLSLMTKLNFVSSGRTKSFRHIRPSSEAQVLFLYFAKLFSPNTNNILTNELLPVSFIPSEDIQGRLKRLSLKGFFNMNFNGVALNIELTHSYEGICDVLYN